MLPCNSLAFPGAATLTSLLTDPYTTRATDDFKIFKVYGTSNSVV